MIDVPIFDSSGNCERVTKLRDMGVQVWGAERVYIGPEVPLESIQPHAVIMNAIITGRNVGIGAHSRIGISGNATIHDCYIGERVEVGAGVFEQSTLLHDVKVRGSAEFREGTLLEEQAEVGHHVGLKNTILTVAVVTGSLINFCDVLATGGTSRRDHSEIGSGTVHFNFDPRGDKFGSLLGDAKGVLLRSRRIFVGGNTGIVAPIHIHYGSVVAAGSVLRKDVAANTLSFGNAAEHEPQPFDPEIYRDLRRKFITTAKLIGTMHALRAWYKMIRIPFAKSSELPLYRSAEGRLEAHVRHRVRELDNVISKLERSLSKQQSATNSFEGQHRMLVSKRQQITASLMRSDCNDWPRVPDEFLEHYGQYRQVLRYTEAIEHLSSGDVELASTWLERIAKQSVAELESLFARHSSIRRDLHSS